MMWWLGCSTASGVKSKVFVGERPQRGARRPSKGLIDALMDAGGAHVIATTMPPPPFGAEAARAGRRGSGARRQRLLDPPRGPRRPRRPRGRARSEIAALVEADPSGVNLPPPAAPRPTRWRSPPGFRRMGEPLRDLLLVRRRRAPLRARRAPVSGRGRRAHPLGCGGPRRSRLARGAPRRGRARTVRRGARLALTSSPTNETGGDPARRRGRADRARPRWR